MELAALIMDGTVLAGHCQAKCLQMGRAILPNLSQVSNSVIPFPSPVPMQVMATAGERAIPAVQ